MVLMVTKVSGQDWAGYSGTNYNFMAPETESNIIENPAYITKLWQSADSLKMGKGQSAGFGLSARRGLFYKSRGT